MAHEPYIQLINLDLDGLMNERQRSDLRQHVRTCAVCARAWERMSRTDRMLKSQPEVGPRAGFTGRVMKRVASYEQKRRWYPWFLVVLGGLTLAAMTSLALPIVFVVLDLYRPLLDWPIIGTIAGYAGRLFVLVNTLMQIVIHHLVRWVSFLTTNPGAIAIVVGALSLAAIWIGLLEVMKYHPATEVSQQSA